MTSSTYEITFDGGSINNPGLGYGSYVIFLGDVEIDRMEKEEFGNPITNNQAEYLSLTRALEWLLAHLGSEAPSARVVVRGDSQLVLNQLNGSWKVRNAGLRPYHARAQELLGRFGSHDLVWHRRDASVKVLGH